MEEADQSGRDRYLECLWGCPVSFADKIQVLIKFYSTQMYESMSTAVVLMIVRGVVFLILVVRTHFFITLCNPLAAPDSRVVVYVGYLVYHIPTMVHIVSVLSDGPDARYISRVVGSWMQSI